MFTLRFVLTSCLSFPFSSFLLPNSFWASLSLEILSPFLSSSFSLPRIPRTSTCERVDLLRIIIPLFPFEGDLELPAFFLYASNEAEDILDLLRRSPPLPPEELSLELLRFFCLLKRFLLLDFLGPFDVADGSFDFSCLVFSDRVVGVLESDPIFFLALRGVLLSDLPAGLKADFNRERFGLLGAVGSFEDSGVDRNLDEVDFVAVVLFRDS